MIGGKNVLIAQVYGLAATGHPEGMRLAGSAELKSCFDLDGPSFLTPRIHVVSQDSERWFKRFLHCEGLASRDPKIVRRAFVVKRNISLLTFVPLAHKASDAPDDLVAVERWVVLCVGTSGVDIIPHIRSEKFGTHFTVHFYDKDESTDNEHRN